MNAIVSPKRLLPLLAISLFTILSSSSTASAHGVRGNVGGAAHASSGNLVTLSVNDSAKDGHCATGRAYLNGQWRRIGTDCSHNGSVQSFTIKAREGSPLSLSVCVGNHTGSRYCHYDTQIVEYGAIFRLPYGLGNDGS